MILITGGAGYIGSHCALRLIEAGRDIVIFDSLDTGHSKTVNTLETLDLKGKMVDFIKGNLQNYNDINGVFKKYKISAVIHFAAFSQVGESVLNPQKYYYNNVFGSLNLFKSMLENNVNKIVFSSSAAVYGEPEYVPIDEEHPKKPINPYGTTKFIIEQILDDYDKAYGLKSVRLRYFNVAGAEEKCRIGEWHEPETHLIPNILKSVFSDNAVFEIYGDDYNTPDGTCIRDYINIDDLISAHISALDYLNNGGKTDYFNLGTKTGSSVKEVFKTCEDIIGKSVKYELKDRREGDPAVLVADNEKAVDILNWEIKHNLKYGIKNAYTWEKKLQDTLLNNK